MNILLATVFDYPHAGGLSTHVTTLKAGLEARGHRVDVVSFSDVPRSMQMMLAKGPSFLLNKVSKGTGILWSHAVRQRLLSRLIADKAASRRYDVINAQEVFATLAALPSGIPTVTTVHGYMTYEAISRGAVVEGSRQAQHLLEKEIEAYTKTRKIITVDQRIKEYVREKAGVEATAIRNFIDVDRFKPEKANRLAYRKKHGVPENAAVIFVPRRLTKKNGVIYPALALPHVLEKYPNAMLIYAGMGEAYDELKSLIEQRGLSEKAKLLGAIPHETMTEYYALSDIVLVPSVHSAGVEEATSISALEAMGSGSPLIASAVGGLKEIVNHRQDGLLVEEKNVDELAQAIIELLDHPEFGQQLAQAARRKIEDEYSHLSAAKKYEDIYRAALAP
ncbi:glycosyl transferase family 1 [Geobacillus subterraneus]|uniref:Glycosyl transferase family 1 n=2 Tax=Geobacillus TaxID=129337 RepID=A0ABN4NCR2_9BACL|nr:MULTISPECIES: glycosyltransferase family 4 protein [Geobacillus]AMX82275.1 glycosyl transferase family 1 [Geobacillus subterraneus]KZS26438.1 glycosyl transferase family 1 [Geobacillus subterraneus]OXB91313.1 glycosyl transferase family 1 [Geobacillus uzenensis]